MVDAKSTAVLPHHGDRDLSLVSDGSIIVYDAVEGDPWQLPLAEIPPGTTTIAAPTVLDLHAFLLRHERCGGRFWTSPPRCCLSILKIVNGSSPTSAAGETTRNNASETPGEVLVVSHGELPSRDEVSPCGGAGGGFLPESDSFRPAVQRDGVLERDGTADRDGAAARADRSADEKDFELLEVGREYRWVMPAIAHQQFPETQRLFFVDVFGVAPPFGSVEDVDVWFWRREWRTHVLFWHRSTESATAEHETVREDHERSLARTLAVDSSCGGTERTLQDSQVSSWSWTPLVDELSAPSML